MKIQFASDLHLEFAENRNFIEDDGIVPVGEVLVLAGDVSYLGDKNMLKRRFFDWCAEYFKETFIVPGNHEFYHGYILQAYHHWWPFVLVADAGEEHFRPVQTRASFVVENPY